ASSGEMARLFRVIRTRLRLGNWKDARHVLVVRDALRRLHRSKAWKAGQIMHRDDPLLDVVDVVGAETAAPLVECQSKTTASMIRRGEGATGRSKAEVGVEQQGRHARFASGTDEPAVPAVGAVYPVVQSPAQTIHVAVSDPQGEAFE